MNLYTPADLDHATACWGANCGPGALAAVLRIPLAGVRRAFPHFPEKAFTTPTTMEQAIRAMGARFTKSILDPHDTPRWPRYGIAQIQFLGPWMTIESWGRRVAPLHSHFVGVCSENGSVMIYDVNAEPAGGWSPVAEWISIAKELVADNKRRTGWGIRVTYEV